VYIRPFISGTRSGVVVVGYIGIRIRIGAVVSAMCTLYQIYRDIRVLKIV